MIDVDEIIQHHLKASEEAIKSAQTLFDSKHYVHSLFFCDLAIERILKALVVKKTGEHAAAIHNLVSLLEIANITLSPEQLADLKEINTYNIKARYDDYKDKFYKKATKSYTEKYFEKSLQLHQWLKEQLTK